MTREMNKPDWYNNWVHKDKEKPSNSRELEDWKPFMDELNKRLENK